MDDDTTEVGHIVAYLSMDNTAWSRAVEQAKRDLRELNGQDATVRLRLDDADAEAKLRLINQQIRDMSRQSPDVRVKTDAKQATAQFSLLRDSILLLGSAAVPLAGVLAGSLAGLAPTLAVVALGVKGISDDMKSGALQGTQYGQDIAQATTELTNLKQIAANGLLGGIDTAMQQSSPLFAALNNEAQSVSEEFGAIAGNTAPALLSILTDLQPLFTTIGAELEKGAVGLDHWATSGKGVQGFVAYVQANLPLVEHTISELVTLISHLAQGLAPMGTATLSAFGTLVTLLNRLPVSTLQVLLPLIVATRVAMLSYSGVTSAVEGVGKAYAALTAPIRSSALAAEAARLQTSAGAEQEAATVAQAKAAEAESAANTAREFAAAQAQIGSVLAEGAAAAAADAAAEAEAFQAKATAAQASADRISAAAEQAALASETESVGIAGILGPMAAVGAGLAVFGGLLLGSSHDAQDASQAMNSYSDSVKGSTNALSLANIEQTNSNLASKGVLTTLQQLQAAYGNIGVSQNDLTTAVNGTQKQYQGVVDKLNEYTTSGDKSTKQNFALSLSVLDMVKNLGVLREGLSSQLLMTNQTNSANAAAAGITDKQSVAAARLFGLVGTDGVTAYLAAQKAASDNTAQTNAQTLAFELENDAASLLNQALQTMAGQNLSVAQAQTSFAQATNSVATAMAKGKTAIQGNSTTALANQQAIQGSVSAARQLAQAVAQQTNSNDQAVESYKKSKTALEDELRARGELTPAVQDYINKLFDVKGISDYLNAHPTKADLDTRAIDAKVAAAKAEIESIKQNQVPGITADTAAATLAIENLQAYIDNLHGKTVQVGETIHYANGTTLNPEKGRPGHATGGKIVGPGTGTSDSIVARIDGDGSYLRVSNGEYVSTAASTRRNEGALAAANRGATLGVIYRATGGPIGGVTSTGSGKSEQWVFAGQQYASKTAAENARTRAIVAEVKLITTIDDAGLQKFEAALNGTADQARSAFATIATSLKQVNVPASTLDQLRGLNTVLDRVAAHRDALRAELGSPAAAPTAYDALAQAKSDYANEKSTVTSNAESGFDIGKAAAADGSVSFGSIDASAIQYANQLTAFYNGLQKLAAGVFGKSSTGRAMLQKLREEGPGAYPQVRALLAASPAQDQSLISTQARIDAEAAKLGTAAANTADGAAVTSAQNRVNRLKAEIAIDSKSITRLGDQIEKAVERAVGRIKIELDGKKTGKAVTTGNNRNKRRN